MTISQQQYHDALEEMLRSTNLRVLLWRIIVEDCKVFEESFPMNASAYCLLAKQEIGKRLLTDAKAVNFEAVQRAEQEYNDLMERNQKAINQEGEE